MLNVLVYVVGIYGDTFLILYSYDIYDFQIQSYVLISKIVLTYIRFTILAKEKTLSKTLKIAECFRRKQSNQMFSWKGKRFSLV